MIFEEQLWLMGAYFTHHGGLEQRCTDDWTQMFPQHCKTEAKLIYKLLNGVHFILAQSLSKK